MNFHGTGTLDNDYSTETIYGGGLFETMDMYDEIGEEYSEEDFALMYFSQVSHDEKWENELDMVGACEVAAFMNGKPCKEFLKSEDICKFIQKHKRLYDRKQIEISKKLIDELIEDMFMYQEWEDFKKGKGREWLENLQDLSKRLDYS